MHHHDGNYEMEASKSCLWILVSGERSLQMSQAFTRKPTFPGSLKASAHNSSRIFVWASGDPDDVQRKMFKGRCSLKLKSLLGPVMIYQG